MFTSNQLPNLRIKFILAFLLVAFALAGCATVSTQVNDPKFISENHPIREVKVLIASDGSFSREQIQSLMTTVSRSLEEQVGVRLKTTEFVDIRFGQREPIPMLEALFERSKDHETDLVIGFGAKAPLDLVKTSLLGGWQAVIDDTFRRYIVTTGLDTHNLMHEIAHAFIISHAHSDGGLMAAVTVQVIPGVPIFQSNYLTAQDRQEILKNKWRNFAEVQPIDPKEREHTINLTSLVNWPKASK